MHNVVTRAAVLSEIYKLVPYTTVINACVVVALKQQTLFRVTYLARRLVLLKERTRSVVDWLSAFKVDLREPEGTGKVHPRYKGWSVTINRFAFLFFSSKAFLVVSLLSDYLRICSRR